MATLTARRAAATFPVAGHGFSGNLKVATGTYTLSANPTVADIINFCRVPAGAVVIGGVFYGGDIDTNATETFDMDIGWAANGVDSADPDGFGNFGVQNGDAVTNVRTEVGIWLPFGGVLLTAGPKLFTKETIITGTVVAVAATFASVPLSVNVHYIVDPAFSAAN
jgi:hypothetical protein